MSESVGLQDISVLDTKGRTVMYTRDSYPHRSLSPVQETPIDGSLDFRGEVGCEFPLMVRAISNVQVTTTSSPSPSDTSVKEAVFVFIGVGEALLRRQYFADKRLVVVGGVSCLGTTAEHFGQQFQAQCFVHDGRSVDSQIPCYSRTGKATACGTEHA